MGWVAGPARLRLLTSSPGRRRTREFQVWRRDDCLRLLAETTQSIGESPPAEPLTQATPLTVTGQWQGETIGSTSPGRICSDSRSRKQRLDSSGYFTLIKSETIGRDHSGYWRVPAGPVSGPQPCHKL